MSTKTWVLSAPKNETSGGVIVFAKAVGSVKSVNTNAQNYQIGFKCVKEGGLLGSPKYEAYSNHCFVKFWLPTDQLVQTINSAKLHLRAFNGTVLLCPSHGTPDYVKVDVWSKRFTTQPLPSAKLTSNDYSFNGWEYTNSTSADIYSLVGSVLHSGEFWLSLDVTDAVLNAIADGSTCVFLRFTLGWLTFPFTSPKDWDYNDMECSLNEELWLSVYGAMSIGEVDSPSGFEESKCGRHPWLEIEYADGQEQPTPGEPGEPTVINCVDADTEAQMAIAGTDGGGLWATWSGGIWYKIYDHNLPITAAYMDYIKNFVNYPDEQISWFGTVSGEVFKSSESFHSWRNVVTFDGCVHDIEGSDLDSNKVAVCVGSNVYTTTDGGESWVFSKSLGALGSGLMVRGDEIQVIAEGGTGYRSPNFGGTWYNLTGITSTARDVGFNNFDEKNSFVGVSGYLYVYDSGTGTFSYTQGAVVSGAVTQVDVSHRTSVAVVATTEKLYKTVSFGKYAYELLNSPAQAVALGGLLPVVWEPKPSDKPDNIFINNLYEPTYLTPYRGSLIRNINGDIYCVIQGDSTGGTGSPHSAPSLNDFCVKRSQDGGHTWSTVTSLFDIDIAVDYPPALAGGAQIFADSGGNIHLMYGVWGRRRTSGFYFMWTASVAKIDHTLLKPNGETVRETWFAAQTTDWNNFTSAQIVRSAINSRGEHVIWYSTRVDTTAFGALYPKYQFEQHYTYTSKKCPVCGWGYWYTSGDAEFDVQPYTSYHEAVNARKFPEGGLCPRLDGGTVTMTQYWPSYRFYRSGYSHRLVGTGLGQVSYELWTHNYPFNIWSSTLNYNLSLIIDSEDTIHITYYDTTRNKTVYINKPYGEEMSESYLNWGAYHSSVGLIHTTGAFDAVIDQYDNIHYFLGTDYYVIKFADGTWSSQERQPLGLSSPSSWSRSWNGTVWQIAHVGSVARAYRRLPLSAPISSVSQETSRFRVSNPYFTVTNYSFESAPDLTGWTKSSGDGYKSSTKAYHGSYSMRLVGTTASYYQINNWVMPERTLVLSVWVWCAYGDRAMVSIGDRVSDGSVGWELSSSYHSGSSGWEQITVTRSIRDGSNQVGIWCQISNGASIEAFFDDVRVRCLNPFSELSVGDRIQVINSVNNNGTYKLSRSPTYDSDNETSTFYVSELIPHDSDSGDIIAIDFLTAAGYTCGIWNLYKSVTVGGLAAFNNTPCTLHSNYPADANGVYSSMFNDGFAVAGRRQPSFGTAGRWVWYWSDPPETKLLGEGNGDN